MDYRKPIPNPSPESKPYWEALREHRLVMPRCEACEKYWFPPSLYCPHCSSTEWSWQPVKGTGRIFSFVVYHRVYHPGFAEEMPYAVAVIALDEGPRMLSNVVGTPPDKLACDMRVEVVFDDITPDATIPKFRVVAT